MGGGGGDEDKDAPHPSGRKESAFETLLTGSVLYVK
jgi:hypothetical protein